MDYIDSKYIGILGVRLEQFKKRGKNLWNFRCPICGDSAKDKTKARGFIFEYKGDTMFKCHNCGVSTGLQQLIQHVDPNLKREYLLEKFGTKKKKPKLNDDFFKNSKKEFKSYEGLKDLTRVDLLATDHPAFKYIESRKIPSKQYKRLYYTDTFKAWTNTIVKNKFSNIKKDEGRIVIPFFDQDDKLIAFQGRSLDPNNPLRYITIKIDDSDCKLFGLNKMDESKPVYVVEGPIDSLFLDNAIAMAGSDLSSKCRLNNNTHFIIVMDNENRNKEIVKKIDGFIDNGFSVCIWDENIKEKDINDMVLSGMTPDNIMRSIESHTYKGLKAKLALGKWRRV